MAHFHKHPGGERISGKHLIVDGFSVTIGLWGYLDFQQQELLVTNAGDHLMFQEVGTSGESKLWKISVRPSIRATRETVKDRILANTVRWETWDQFEITFRFKKQDAASLAVRSITADGLGGAAGSLWRSTETPMIHIVDPATFRTNQLANRLNFRPMPGKPVQVAVFAAKLGAVERAYILMAPPQPTTNLLIVISHSFGQNDGYYSGLGYSNPLSPPLIDDALHRFVLGRWGSQLMAARSDCALLMPVRAKAGSQGSELGPFVDQAGVGTQIIQKIIGLTGGHIGIQRVELVTFSNGIWDANQFIAAGGKGLNIQRACNQDPAGGAAISSAVPARKQYLSGQTTAGQPRPGFEFLPLQRWENEPEFTTRWTNDRFNYLHTWCLPHYTLYMALTM